jgi:7-alpha-hydroxysteroid dehydrogenase
MILDKFSLAGRVAIITGSGRGIGKGIALAFAEAGADVVVLARTVPEIEETAAQIRALGRRSSAIPTDVRKADQVANMVKRAVDEFGHIDILVNNAGGMFQKSILEITENGWDAIVNENLKTVFLCTQAVATVMMKQDTMSSIVNITSYAATIGAENTSPYAAAKAGVIAFTKASAWEFAPKIRVNAISVGSVMTEFYLKNFPDIENVAAGQCLMKRIGRPEDIALAALYLASDASSFVTQETFYINGGIVGGQH